MDLVTKSRAAFGMDKRVEMSKEYWSQHRGVSPTKTAGKGAVCKCHL